jgi:WD repeat-containing protein 45
MPDSISSGSSANVDNRQTSTGGPSSAASLTLSPSNSLCLTCTFNQDGGCLAVGTTTGFAVYNVHPQTRPWPSSAGGTGTAAGNNNSTTTQGSNAGCCTCTVQRTLPSGGGIGGIEMLFRCNLMALVGGGPSPHAPPHRVLIWDDHIPKEIGELSFRQVVLRVKLRKDAIAVALRDRVYVYHLTDLSLRDKIYTADNPYGLLCLSTHIQEMVLACPSVTTGHVRVELYGLRKTVVSGLNCL